MVTIGRGLLDASVHEFFEGIRTYDAKRALAVLADDADFDSPWSGHLTGTPDIEAFLKRWLADPVGRPSFTIIDIAGDGAVARLRVSVSGRFGKAPEHHDLTILCLKHVVHQVKFVCEPKSRGH
jgi:ketosteroid isomerase-like protein